MDTTLLVFSDKYIVRNVSHTAPQVAASNYFYTYTFAFYSVRISSLGVLRTFWYEGASIVRHWTCRRGASAATIARGRKA